MDNKGKMIYTSGAHIPIMMVYRDATGIVRVTFKRAGKGEFETLSLDELLAAIYSAVA